MAEKVVLQIRLDELTHRKTKFVADKELRSLNAQMEYFILKGVESFERENGPIYLDVSEEDRPNF